jgi:hypothetical protein
MLYGSFFKLDNLPLSITVIPMIASKTTIIWCPILEMLFNSSVRNNLLFIQNFKKDDIILPQEALRIYTNYTKKNQIAINVYDESALSLNEFRHTHSKHPDLHELSFKLIKEFEIF